MQLVKFFKYNNEYVSMKTENTGLYFFQIENTSSVSYDGEKSNLSNFNKESNKEYDPFILKILLSNYAKHFEINL